MLRTRALHTIVLSVIVVFVVTGSLVPPLAPSPAAAASPSTIAGPPWISIEYPVNPFDRTTRGAHLLVHAYHHGTPIGHPVSGTAEGIVNGERRSVTLRFETTSRTGVYALRKQWPSEGVWTLVIAVTQGEDRDGAVAQALIELSPAGAVSSVNVPTRQHAEGRFPRRLTTAEVETAVRDHAQRLALGGRARS